jgi:prephenate dehydrogenase
MNTIGVIGFGRFGEMWARAIAPFRPTLVYDLKWDRQETRPTLAPPLVQASLEQVAQCDVLFLAVPISQIEACCQKLSRELSSNSVVVDVCSVKLHPAKVMQEALRREQPLIGTHPLFGPDSVARLGLEGRKIVFCQLRATPEQTKTVRSILELLKLQIIESTADEHDRQMAHSQALVHLLGRALASLNLGKQEISTPDYESLLNISSLVNNDTWQLFFDMHRYNPYAEEMRRTLRVSLDDLEARISKSHNTEPEITGQTARRALK